MTENYFNNPKISVNVKTRGKIKASKLFFAVEQPFTYVVVFSTNVKQSIRILKYFDNQNRA